MKLKNIFKKAGAGAESETAGTETGTAGTATGTAASSEKPRRSGSRNLMILGVSAILITVLTSGVSLFLYHESGDIYIDRSRPGFLPDKKEAGEEKDSDDYSLPEDGRITEKTLDKYLDEFDKKTHSIDDPDTAPFTPDPLSDESLGIRKKE